MSNATAGDTTRSLGVSDAGFAAPGGDTQGEQALCAVLAFHPAISRIGEVFSPSPKESTISFGRYTPQFLSPDNGALEGMGDNYVSRQAFHVSREGEFWRLLRHEGSSRLRINGEELRGEATLSEEQLMAGVVVTLAQRIVLHLRLRTPWVSGNEAAALASLRGVSPAMGELRKATRIAAGSRDDVLLMGPTGSGKERIARAIHALDCHSGEPWVAVNMAALPVEIASASLFGARKGAYTGADSHRQGFFQEADGGTLFLDEIGDTPASLQPLLLRALQEREVQVVGGKTQRVDLRVIAAMEQDPDQLGDSFRPALRYRLGAQEIRLPSLAERAEDVALLAADFFHACAHEQGQSWDVHRGNVGPGAWARLFEQLLLYSWPGNIRELQHVVAQISKLSDSGLQVPVRVRERWLALAGDVMDGGDQLPGRNSQIEESPTQSLADISDEVFAEAWKNARYEVATIARNLGVSRPAIYRRLHTLHDCRLAADVPLGELLSALDACRGDLGSTAEYLAVSLRGLQTRLRASGVTTVNLPEIFEGQESG